MKQECSGGSCAKGLASFLIGGLLGAGAALLAPQSGKETRTRIKGMADSVRDTTEDYYDRIKSEVISALENGQGFVEKKKELIASAVQAGIEAYQKGQRNHDGDETE